MINNAKGIENGVKWSINTDKFNPIVITVESNKGKEVIEYKLEYPNAVFGYDWVDVQNVNNILDRLIEKYKIVII